jgi:type IV pilus assembly protein PilY1
MSFKNLILKISILFLILTGNVFAKALPPGSGQGDVPANILILLDKSGSMGARMTGGTTVYYPEAIAFDSSGDIYISQYYTYGIKKFSYSNNTLDVNFGSSGTYRGTSSRGACPVYYPKDMQVHNGYLYFNSYYSRKIARYNLSTKKCETVVSTGSYPHAFQIQNNILYSLDRSNIKVRNLSTNTNISCSFTGDLRSYGRYSYAMTVDQSGNNMYLKRSSRTYQFVIDANTKCPSTTVGSQFIDGVGSTSYGMVAHPTDDSIIYYSNYYSHRIEKVTMNTARNGVASRVTKGRCCRGGSTSNPTLYYPRNVAIDVANNRVGIADYYNNGVKVFDLNLTMLKAIGGSVSTRMTGAHEAIKAIVTDSSLTSGVNFGFGYWSSSWSSGVGFRSWSGNITTGKATPCDSRACITVRAHKAGAARINSTVSSVSPGGGTNAADWAKQAKEYYLHSSLSPIDKNLTCQNSYVLVIGDGSWGGHSTAIRSTTALRTQHGIKTFTVAYGGGIGSWGIRNFRAMAQAGGTNDVIIANTTAALKAQLKAAIMQVIASKLSFTAPAITATIEKDGSLFQAQFDYVQNEEWQGTLKRTAINKSGVIDINDKGNWSASDVLKQNITKRKIWTALNGIDYKTNYNNFVDSNATAINNLFQLTNNEVQEYHSKTQGTTTGSIRPQNTTRCASASGVADGNDDDIKGLINFVRGQDYFDYDADCKLTEIRKNPLGDIYHSELVVVGAPGADTSFASTNQESYWRAINGYDAWAKSNSNRKEMIYVGANDGLLHAFDAKNGQEMWAFAPPLLLPSFPTMVNQNLNRAGKGGSNAIFGVDGSATVHDMYFKSALDNSKKWHTILFIPYGRGGAGFSVLDVTEPLKPLHLVSVLNDKVLHTVHVMDHNSSISSFNYIATSYALSSLNESVQVQDNANDNRGSQKCDATGNNQCFKSKTWTFPVNGLSKADLRITKDGKNYNSFTVTNNSSGQTIINFSHDITYYGYDSCASAPAGTCTTQSSNVGFEIKSTSKATGVTQQPEYDYSKLGETWSAPRIFRLPTDGRTDTNLNDDRYVAVMGGGYGTQFEGVGNALFVIDLEDSTNPGSIEKVIDIQDSLASDIINSTPGTPVVVTPDTTRGLNFRGALVYLNDFEGKITKFNLTNMAFDNGDPKTGKKIDIYDNTTLFWAGSTKTNGRYMYHSMDAGIGKSTNTLWLFAGTGDFDRIADRTKGVQNLLLGIKDENYPMYKDVDGTIDPAPAKNINDLTKCKDVTKDTTGASCPQKADKGWYATLKDFRKVTAEPTVSRGLVYFPIYKPSSSVNACSLGDAMICGLDDECGTNVSSQLGKNVGSQKSYACKYVGQGVLSKIIVFAGKIFANIAGQTNCDAITDAKKKKECQATKDLVQIDAAVGDITSYRSSWRHNY